MLIVPRLVDLLVTKFTAHFLFYSRNIQSQPFANCDGVKSAMHRNRQLRSIAGGTCTGDINCRPEKGKKSRERKGDDQSSGWVPASLGCWLRGPIIVRWGFVCKQLGFILLHRDYHPQEIKHYSLFLHLTPLLLCLLGSTAGHRLHITPPCNDLGRDSLRGQCSILYSHNCQLNILYNIIYYYITKILTGHAEFQANRDRVSTRISLL